MSDLVVNIEDARESLQGFHLFLANLLRHCFSFHTSKAALVRRQKSEWADMKTVGDFRRQYSSAIFVGKLRRQSSSAVGNDANYWRVNGVSARIHFAAPAASWRSNGSGSGSRSSSGENKKNRAKRIQ